MNFKNLYKMRRHHQHINEQYDDNKHTIEDRDSLDPINKLAQDEFVKTGKIPSRLKPLITQIEIPDNVTSIGDCAFEGCRNLTSVTIPNSVTSIGYSAFRGCVSLTSVTIPDSVTTIGDCAFNFCRVLTSITIPNSVTSIGDKAFYSCDGLKSITIPNSVTSIGVSAFQWCESLTSVTIPDSVTSIGEGAFSDCEKLTIQTTSRIAKLLRNSEFDGNIISDERETPEDSLMREFVEVLKMDEY